MRRAESTDSNADDLHAAFVKIISALTDGDLTFKPPFDLATSAALAANLDTGRIAEALFEVTAQRDTGYRVQISAVAPGVDDREVIDTVVASTPLLVALLDGLLAEYEAPDEDHP